MTDLPRITQARIRAGVWEGEISGGPPSPQVEVTHLERPLPDVVVTPLADRPGHCIVRVPIPAAVLHDGVQTFLVRDTASGATLGHFSIITGVPLEDDLRAEIDLLRAELDLLKRAFRRHCVETARDQS